MCENLHSADADKLKRTAFGDEGVSYVMVLFTIAVLGTASLSFALMTGLQRDIASNYASNAQAHYLARAGLNGGIWDVMNRPAYLETYDGEVMSYEFQGMTADVVFIKAEHSDALLMTSIGTVGKASSKLRHLMILGVGETGLPPMVTYGEGTQTAPRYRIWQGAAWLGEAAANPVDDDIRWVVLRDCPVRDEKVLGTLDDANHTYAQVWDGSSWGSQTQLTTGGDASSRTFDVAYESVSGDALIVYRRAYLETDVYYRTWDGSQLSNEIMLDLPTYNWPKYVTMASNPDTDEIVLAVLDNSENIVVSVWNGDVFTHMTKVTTGGAASSEQCTAVAYEFSSGEALVVWGDGNTDLLQYVVWDGSDWSGVGDGPGLGSGARAAWASLASDPNSDMILCGILDNKQDVNVLFWDGVSWGAVLEVETGAETHSSRCFDVAFETGGEAMVAWSDAGDHSVDYRTWTSGAWQAQQNGPDVGNDITILQLVSDPDSDEMFMTTKTDDSDLQVTKWDGSSWGTADEIETNSSGGLDYESFMVAY